MGRGCDVWSTYYVCDPRPDDLKAANSKQKKTDRKCSQIRKTTQRSGAEDKIIRYVTGM